MPDVGEVRYKVKVDDSNVEQDIKSTEDKLEKGGKRVGSQFAQGLKAGMDPVKSDNEKLADAVTGKWQSAAKVVGASFAALTAGAVAFGVKSIDLASDLSEVQNVVDVTFGDSADKVNKWAKEAGAAYGMSELAAKQYASTIGAMLKSMGMSADATEEMSLALTGLAGDMASFYNLDASDAFEKLRAGISGETEPLKQLGINMSVANLEAFAMEKGLLAAADGSKELAQARDELALKEMKLEELRAKGTATASQIASAELAVQKAQDKVNDSLTVGFDELDAATQAQIRYEYIMQATADAQGDFSRTSDSLANQQRILQMEVETLSADLGTALLPAALEVVGGLRSMVGWVSENGDKLGILAISVAGITAAIIAYSASLTLAASGMTLASIAGAAFGAVLGFITSPITLVILGITALIAAGVALYQNWDTVSAWAGETWQKIQEVFATGVEAVKGLLQAVIDFVKNNWVGLALLLVNPFVGAFKLLYDNFEGFRNTVDNIVARVKQAFVNMGTGISTTVGNIRDAIVNGFQRAVEYITGLPGKALQWGKDFVQGFVDGIKNKLTAVADTVKGVANTIASYLHFSRPDRGPLREYEEWGPDMLKGIARTITDNTGTVEKAASHAAAGIASGIARGLGAAAYSVGGLPRASRQPAAAPAAGISPGIASDLMHGLMPAAPSGADYGDLRQTARALMDATQSPSTGGSIRIEVPLSIDGREVARATAWYMDEQLAWEER
ncbi:hypothetical protein H6B33_01230 [Gemmiger formicilis]|uniref:hypothetical protein n=1 Tax=Gemmiger formicilis TaxID=745368 RepID=UPI00195CAB43|nr:hypothetical protein [Gemmiger formicilis]MBM6914026.1 hypothetical protein [Gemmiger formicilis]